MGIRDYKPTSLSRRGMTGHDFSDITKTKPEKRLTKGISKSGGHGNTGRITVRFRGGGHKRKFRTIDFHREKTGIPAQVAAIEYDPNANGSWCHLVRKNCVGAGIEVPGKTVCSSSSSMAST